MAVPCGKCPKCVKRRISAWSFRLLQEDKKSETSIFLTLTYDTAKVPITRNGFMTLDKDGVQKFMKRLRKSHPATSKIKYYLVGEYGGKTKRPHYHLILFNADIKLIQAAWSQGAIHYGKVEGASVGYTLKYMIKTGTRIPAHRNDDRQPEFGLMSKGLGVSYITTAMQTWHLADKENRMYCNLPDGKKITMPRYFKQKIYNEHERKAIGIQTRKRQLEAEDKAIANYNGDYERDRAQAVDAAFKKMQSIKAAGTTL